MSYPINTAIPYVAVPHTDGYVAGDHTVAWTFDDSTTGSGASVNKTWTTLGQHSATATATNTITGGSGNRSVLITIASPPSSLLNSINDAKAFVDPSGNTWVAMGSSSATYQYNELLANGTTSRFNTTTFQDSSNLTDSFFGSTSAAISADGLWIVFCGQTGGSVAQYLTVINTSTGAMKTFDMKVSIATGCFPSSGNTVMIVPRSDNKFAISTAQSAAATQYTFIYDPVTNTHASVVNGSYAYIAQMAFNANDGYVYLTRKSYGGNTIARYNVAGHSWDTVTLASTQYDSSTRNKPGIVKMADGKFLLVGGDNGGTAIANVAVFDTTALTITDKTSMNTARCRMSCALLPNGKVLVAGGRVSVSGVGLSTAEIYDPVANTWTAIASMSQGRGSAPIAQLPSGNFVLIGGVNGSGTATATIEYFHPADNTFYSVD